MKHKNINSIKCALALAIVEGAKGIFLLAVIILICALVMECTPDSINGDGETTTQKLHERKTR